MYVCCSVCHVCPMYVWILYDMPMMSYVCMPTCMYAMCLYMYVCLYGCMYVCMTCIVCMYVMYVMSKVCMLCMWILMILYVCEIMKYYGIVPVYMYICMYVCVCVGNNMSCIVCVYDMCV